MTKSDDKARQLVSAHGRSGGLGMTSLVTSSPGTDLAAFWVREPFALGLESSPMPLIPITCLLADRLFPCTLPTDATEVEPVVVSHDAGLRLEAYGLPLGEVEFDIPIFVEQCCPVASDGGMFVGHAWVDGVKYEISC